MRRPLFVLSVCIILCVAVYRRLYPAPTTDPPDKSHILLCGKVIEKDETSFVIRQQKLSFHIRSDKIQSDKVFEAKAENLNYSKLQCEYENASDLMLGSIVWLEGEFREYTPAGNPGEFDYAAYYHSLDYAGKLQNIRILAVDSKKIGLREGLYRLRLFWQKRLYQIFPEKEASVMTAMLLGDKTDLDPDLKELYRKNGIIHILSISGLHITLIGVGFYKRLRRLGVPVCIAALSGGILLFLYGMLTGFGISACRAIGMYLIRMLSHIVGRTYDMLTALGAVAVVLVCTHPAWLGHMGFLLSFCSVLGVGALLPALEKGLAEDQAGREPSIRPQLYVADVWKQKCMEIMRKCAEMLKQGFLAGLSVTLTTLPVQLWFSYEVSVYSLILNILILPFMSIVMVAGLTAMLIPGTGIIGTLDVFILAGYEWLCKLFEKMPYSMWNPGRPQIWQVILYYLIWMCIVWGIPWIQKRMKQKHLWQQRKNFSGLRCQIVLSGLLLLLLLFPGAPQSIMTFLDVGQGDGMCLQLATGEVYLFDCGSSSRERIGERVLIPFLKYYGIHRVDAVFISHGDADHLNGLLELLTLSEKEHIAIRQVVLPDLPPENLREEFDQVFQVIRQMSEQPAVTTICAGTAWQSEGKSPVSFLCLHPLPSRSENTVTGGNACSECICISFPVTAANATKDVKLLLTGDVEGVGERELLTALRTYQISHIDIFKCAHHGSKGTTGEELLAQITPRDTVISCGRNNRYGHPHAELLSRLETIQSRVYQTPRTGAVTVRITRNGYKILTYK